MDLAQVKEEAKRAAFVVARGVRDLGRAFDASSSDHGPAATASTTGHNDSVQAVVAEAVKAAREGAQGLVRATIAVRNHHNSTTSAAAGADRERQVKEAEEQAQKVAGTALRLATAAPRVAALPSPDARREAAAAVDRVRTQLFEDVKVLLARLLALLPPAPGASSATTHAQSEDESYVANLLSSSSASSSSSRAGEESRQRQRQADEDRDKREEEEERRERERRRKEKAEEDAERMDREIRELQRVKEEKERRESEEREQRARAEEEKEKEERDRKAREKEERDQKARADEEQRERERVRQAKEAKEKEERERQLREEQEKQRKEQQERQKQREEQEKQRKEQQQQKQQLEEQERQRREQERERQQQQEQQLREDQEKQRKEHEQEQIKLNQQQSVPPQALNAQAKTENPKPKAAVATGPELKVIAVNTFRPEFDDELAFVEDEVFSVFAAVAEDTSIWWGRHRGKEGIFPSECVEVLQGEPDKLMLKSVEEDEAESEVAQQPTTEADSFVPLALLLPTTEVGEGEVQVKAVSDYKAASDDELSFVRDDVFAVTAVLREDDLYLWGKLRGRVGYFPRRFVVAVAGDVTMLPERAIEEEELRRQHEKLQRKLEAMEKQRQRQEDELKSIKKKGQANKSDDEDKKVDVDREQRVVCKTCESEVVIRKGVLFGICEDCGALVQRERREEDAEALKQKEAQREAEEADRRQREEDERRVKREEYEKKREDDEKRKREEWERKKREDEEERKRQLTAVPVPVPAAPQEEEEPQAAAAPLSIIVSVDDEVSSSSDAPEQSERTTKEKTKSRSPREKEGSYIFGAHRSDAVPKVKFVQDKQLVTKLSPAPSPTSSASIASLASSASTPSGSSSSSSAARAPSAKWGSVIVPPIAATGDPISIGISSPRSPRASNSASSSSSASPASSTSSTPLTSPRGGELDALSAKKKTKKAKKQRSGTLKRLSKKENKTKTKEEEGEKKRKKKKGKKEKKAKREEQGTTEREREMERELAELKQMLMDVQAKLAQKEEEERRRLNERRQSMALNSAAAAAYDSSSSLPQIAAAADPRKLPSASQPPKLGRRESLLHLKQVRESNQQGQQGTNGGAGGGGAWGKHTLRKIDGLQRTGSGRYITGDEAADEESRRKDALRRGIVL